ncbi:MAG: hypothetical protein MK089_12700, partial [Phycisphaerales bacterium]|nr:hypothetical protein [Phycisphaerales bacterium]
MPYRTLIALALMTGTTTLASAGDPAEPGRLIFGIVDINDCYVDMGVNQSTGAAAIWVEANQGNFALGFQVEENSIDLAFTINGGNVYMTNANGTTLINNGNTTLPANSKFAIHGEGDADFTMQWQDEVGDDGADFIGTQCWGCSININGDMASFRSVSGNSNQTSYLEFRGEGTIPMSVIGNVSSSTLALPAFGEEGEVEIPAGIHTIELNSTTDADDDLAWIVMPMGGNDDGDDDDDGCSLPEDVNGN